VAVVGAWVGHDGDARLEWLAGRAGDHDPTRVLAAMGRGHGPLQPGGERPLWIRLGEDQFQPGAAALRQFDLQWALSLPFTMGTPGGARRCVLLLAGPDRDVDPHHPLLRDARLIWLSARGHLAAGAAADAGPAAWPGGDAWNTAPCALALVLPDRVVAVNDRARDLLQEHVGRGGPGWETWLLAAVQRLDASERPREILTASESRDRTLEVSVSPAATPGRPRLVSLHEAAHPSGEAADHESALRMLGHELRTPLAAMQTSLDLVLRGDAGPLAADQQRFLGTARRNLQRLGRLLDDLLDAERAGAGRLAIRPVPLDLGALLQEDLAMHGVACREKGLVLDASGVRAGFRACVDGDKVQQMLHNLLSNAVKYTPRGGRVRVWLEDRADRVPGAGARLARRFGLPFEAFVLGVEDSGLGMSETFVETMFQPFQREERPEARRLPGAGLGLHITRGLVEAHGGEIRLVSQPGQGTTVWLVLPREPESGAVVVAGRQFDALRERAAMAGVRAGAVYLDLRQRATEAATWELEAAARQAHEFLRRLARDSRREDPERLLRGAGGTCCWRLEASLWVGLALDPERLEAAWQVATSAPESSPILAGTRWQTLDASPATDDAAAADPTSTPVG
jgi:signal transduction histidine kinase